MYDKEKFTYTFLDIATRGREECSNPSGCIWIELKVQAEEQPLVITKILAENTPKGPGDVKKAAVWIEGYDPFWIPDKLMERQDKKISNFQGITDKEVIESRIGRLLGKIVTVKKVIARMPNHGERLTAYVSKDIPPLGIVMLKGPHVDMYLRAWGMQRGSWMTKEPVSFYWWIMKQVGRALYGVKE